MTENTIKTVKIKDIINECKGVKTIYFNMKEGNHGGYIIPKAGQFVMVWVPGVDEVPISLSSYDDKGNWAITVKDVGECTNAIHNLKIDDFIGIRGPLGNNFILPNDSSKKLILIGGGIGMAPLKCLSLKIMKKNLKFTIIEGAKIGEEIMFINDFQSLDHEYSEIIYSTDDGSYGLKGFASETFESLVKNYSKSEIPNLMAYTCGPEKMIFKVFQICERYSIKLQASLERIMRCGCGLCGLCAVDPLGLLVCKDGPVFDSKNLRKMDDFGKYKRDFSGKKIPLD